MKKLQLNKSTIRVLTGINLEHARGGDGAPLTFQGCDVNTGGGPRGSVLDCVTARCRSL